MHLVFSFWMKEQEPELWWDAPLSSFNALASSLCCLNLVSDGHVSFPTGSVKYCGFLTALLFLVEVFQGLCKMG